MGCLLACLLACVRALPCLAVPCLALPCLALPCLALPCLALPCLACLPELSVTAPSKEEAATTTFPRVGQEAVDIMRRKLKKRPRLMQEASSLQNVLNFGSGATSTAAEPSDSAAA